MRPVEDLKFELPSYLQEMNETPDNLNEMTHAQAREKIISDTEYFLNNGGSITILKAQR